MMLAHFQNLCASILADPTTPVSRLSLLSEAERLEMSRTARRPAPTNAFVPFGKEEIEQSIPSRFVRCVRTHPRHIAIITKKHRWTYEELNVRANRIALEILAQLGEEQGRVALLLNHDAHAVAAMLGVLKANKAYVPLDPSQPTARHKYVLEDSQASALITNQQNSALAAGINDNALPLINLDQMNLQTPADDAGLNVSPDAVAYMLYTSGSTGRPKGVVQNHRNVLHFIRTYTNNLHIRSEDRLTLFSSYGFDAAVMDIFGALLNGATLCPMNVSEENFSLLPDLIVERGITIYHSTPTVYRYLAGLLGTRQLSGVRLVVLGGEEATIGDFELFKTHFSREALFVNGLGPTESTVSLQFFMDAQTELSRASIPVGYPVEETEVLLVDEQGSDAGVYGEIAIRSPHVALGYWRDPELTRAAFSAAAAADGHRLYRTGDMGRLLPDGSIQFMGRKD
jgi:amino acid adenylation domain-containing protein